MMDSRLPRAFALAPLLALFAGCISIDLPGSRPGPLVETVLEGEGDAKILLVEIDGFLSEESESGQFGLLREESTVARVRSQLEKAARDDDVKAVVLRIHSPGGTTTASEILYREIEAFQEARDVPVVAALMGVATSGAYYAAMSADTIVAHPTTVTGSIGVIFVGVSVAGLMEKLGIENQTIASGPHKDAGSLLSRMTEEERRHIEAVIDDLHERFRAVVAEGRPELDAERIAELADGRIFSAEQAHELGLVDTIEDLAGAVAEARQRAGVEEARVVTYHREREWRENLYSRTPVRAPSLADSLAGLFSVRGPAFLYLWWPAAR